MNFTTFLLVNVRKLLSTALNLRYIHVLVSKTSLIWFLRHHGISCPRMTNQATVTYFAFALLKVESRRTSSAVLAAQCSPTCSISLILLPYSLLLLSCCITEVRAVFLVQLLATGSRSTMNPADHDEVVSQFCAMTRARPDDVGILSQMQKSR